MKQIKFKFIGESPLLMHNNRLANPLDPYSIEMGKKSGKRKKTIEDIKELARIEWEGGLYIYDGEVKIPVRVINKTMERGATKQKAGVLWKTGCAISEDFCPLSYSGKKISVSNTGYIPNQELDEFYDKFSFQSPVRVGQAMILRTRPIFKTWELCATVDFDPTIINRETIIQAAVDAGRLVGFGDWRIEKGGGYGRFRVEVFDNTEQRPLRKLRST